MGVKSPYTYENYFCGVYNADTCRNILEVKQREEIPELKHMIYDLPHELIIRSIREFRSVRDIATEEGISLSEHLGTLRKYQTTGVGFMYFSRFSMIADGVGLGKTAEISGLINFLYAKKEIRRFIIAVESSAFGQTQYELIKFTGLNIVAMPSETDKIKKFMKTVDISKADGIVIKHSTLKNNTFNKFLGLNMTQDGRCKVFDVLFLDESGVIKNDTSQMHQYTRNICNMATRVHFMNATAFDKHLMDIYYQMDTIHPEFMPDKAYMNKHFCVFKRGYYWTRALNENGVMAPKQNTKWDFAGYKNQPIFKNSLQLMYFGRSKEMVGMDIPHVYKVYTVFPTVNQDLAIKKGFRYNEVLNCPSLVSGANIEFTRKEVPKLDRLCELIENELSDMKVMVYCFHVEAQYVIKRELEKLGRKVCILNGKDPGGSDKDIKRLELMNKFNRGEYDVIVTNMQKSLNLHGADAMVLYSTTATVGRLEQIRGRIDRNVTMDAKLFIMLLYDKTAEYELMNTTARSRGDASRELLLDAKTAINYFMDSINEESSQ